MLYRFINSALSETVLVVDFKTQGIDYLSLNICQSKSISWWVFNWLFKRWAIYKNIHIPLLDMFAQISTLELGMTLPRCWMTFKLWRLTFWLRFHGSLLFTGPLNKNWSRYWMGKEQETPWTNDGLGDDCILASPGSLMCLTYSVYIFFRNIKQDDDNTVW